MQDKPTGRDGARGCDLVRENEAPNAAATPRGTYSEARMNRGGPQRNRPSFPMSLLSRALENSYRAKPTVLGQARICV